MTDVTRALLLPDQWPPPDSVLKGLALYWDEIVIPDSAYRNETILRAEELENPPQRSDAALAFEAAGVITRFPADVAAESFMPHPRPPNEDEEGIMLLRIEKDGTGRSRFTGTLRLDPEHLGESSVTEPTPGPDVREASAALMADSLIARARQARELAASNHLAPVAPSLTSHLASLSPEEDGCPMAEGALLSIATDAFVPKPDTPVSAIVEFRERNMRAIQRFRGAMTDLAATIRQSDIPPEATLAAARDVYKNRVEPDLGELEARLSESRIKFLTRSIFGAAALAVSPLTAPTVVENAARLGSQTINYRFSRERLIEEHPYAYLHRLSTADFVIPGHMTGPDLISPQLAPADAVHAQIHALIEVTHQAGLAGSNSD